MLSQFNKGKLQFVYVVAVGLICLSYLVYKGVGLGLSLIIIIPTTWLALIWLEVIYEIVIEPVIRWLKK